jgi:hypothetical protein
MVVSRIRSDRNFCVVDSSLYGVLPTCFGLYMAIRRVVSNRGITSIVSSSYIILSNTAQCIIILELQVNCDVRNQTVVI